MVKVGFIGTGGISRAHLDYLKTRDDVQICALCDVNEQNLKQRVQAYGGRAFNDFRNMLAQMELDAIWVCTPPEVRREPLVACVEKGIPVFCEKPVERSAQQGASIAGELSRLNARVQIGYLFRSMPAVQRLRQYIDDDRIHTVQSVYICNMSLERNLPAWFYDKELSGGPLVDQATHNLDLLRSLLGEVHQVSGLALNPHKQKESGYTIDETIALSFVFEHGIVGTHIHSWLGDAWRNEIVLSGQKGLYRIDLNKGQVNCERDSETTTFGQGSRRIFEFEDELFLRQVIDRDWSTNPCDYADGLNSLRLTLACNRAVESDGSPCTVDQG